MEKRIIIAGSGGQGVLFFGKLLAYAAMLEGREVTWFPSYGAEMRGGTANCTVIISDSMIGSPVIRNPHVLVVMNAASYQRFAEKLSSGGVLVCDSSQIHAPTHRDDIRVIMTPAGDIAASLNCAVSANMALLGAFIAATGIVDVQSALRSVDELIPVPRRDLVAVNKEIIMRGYNSLRAAPSAESGSGKRT
jgi:2-oxoglutarate ferredoxin oxidoreductase subunit gamma